MRKIIICVSFFSAYSYGNRSLQKNTQNTQFRWQSVRNLKAKSVICCKRGPVFAYINLHLHLHCLAIRKILIDLWCLINEQFHRGNCSQANWTIAQTCSSTDLRFAISIYSSRTCANNLSHLKRKLISRLSKSTSVILQYVILGLPLLLLVFSSSHPMLFVHSKYKYNQSIICIV